jgi:hypothetical protein
MAKKSCVRHLVCEISLACVTVGTPRESEVQSFKTVCDTHKFTDVKMTWTVHSDLYRTATLQQSVSNSDNTAGCVEQRQYSRLCRTATLQQSV